MGLTCLFAAAAGLSAIPAAQLQVVGQDRRWRFQWSEVAFLQLWWQRKSQAERDRFKQLVVSGQIELVGGGIVMNDEALTTLFAIVENLNEGRRWIEANIGVSVDTSWQNDPFGLSSTMAYLYSRMGYLGMWIQRVHYRTKDFLAKKRGLEFWWRQRGDPSGESDIYTHLNPFYAYDVPHTCGPQPCVNRPTPSAASVCRGYAHSSHDSMIVSSGRVSAQRDMLPVRLCSRE